MRQAILVTLCLSLSPAMFIQSAPASSSRVVENYGNLPLVFEANQGQSDPHVAYLSRGAGYTVFLTPAEAVLDLRRPSQRKRLAGAQNTTLWHGDAGNARRKTLLQAEAGIVQIKLVGANTKAVIAGQNELPGRSNYFVGNDPGKWQTNVRQFARVRYENVYSGVNLIYYGNQRELEYDFVLRPGADPRTIRLGINGTKRLRLEHGDLMLTTAQGVIRLRSPHVYQERDGIRDEVRGRYVFVGKNEVGFALAAYDRGRTLVIDPVLAYSTYLGGNGSDLIPSIAVDSAGNTYLTGVTDSNDFPTKGPQLTQRSSWDAFVTKINRDGTALIYSTYLGGSGGDNGTHIAVDSAGNAYITGSTDSADFPVVNAIQPQFAGAGKDAFVTKINAAGNSLVYSTYLGGSNYDWGLSIAVGAGGGAYVTGMTNSSDFPTLNAIQPHYTGNSFDYAGFVTKIGPAGKLIYSTYLGGIKESESHGIAVDSTGSAYVTGYTECSDFPTTNAFQSSYAGGGDAFLTKINATGSTIVYSTYLGGSGRDVAQSIAVDSTGDAYITESTFSSDFPTINAIQSTYGGNQDAFVTKFSATANAAAYSTYLGGARDDVGAGIAVDTTGNAYVIGTTHSLDFPVVNPIQATKWGIDNAFVTEIDGDGNALVYSTYLGGPQNNSGYSVAIDETGSAHAAGNTSSLYFPKTLLAFQTRLNGTDLFVAKIATQTFVSLSPLALNLPTKVLGSTSAAKKLSVTNQGSATLAINKIYIGGLEAADFTETNTCGASLAAGVTCTVSVTFTPTEKNLGPIACPKPTSVFSSGTFSMPIRQKLR